MEVLLNDVDSYAWKQPKKLTKELELSLMHPNDVFSGQSYTYFTIIINDSRVVLLGNFIICITLE